MIKKKRLKKVSLIIVVALSIMTFTFSCKQPDLTDAMKDTRTPSVKGTIKVPDSAGLSYSDIWMKVVHDESTDYVGRVSSDGSFAVYGLSPDFKYDIYFSSVEPSSQNYSSKGIDVGGSSKSASSTSGYGGWLSGVSATIDGNKDLGVVQMKPLGTIKGKAYIKDADEHYDIFVYIPGTSYIARTDADGSFAIYNVPEGFYRLRYTCTGYVSQMSDDVIVAVADGSDEHPVVEVPDVLMAMTRGLLSGIVTLEGRADSSGVLVEVAGTGYTAVTDESGRWSVRLPLGNYPGGVRYSHEYYKADSNTGTISILENGEYAVPSAELKCLYVDVAGKAVVRGLSDNSGVSVSIDGSARHSVTTGSSGEFVLEKVPLGMYTVRFSRADMMDVTMVIDVEASDCINLGGVDLIPNAGAISGTVSLIGDGGHAGVRVDVCLGGESIMSTRTDERGEFYMANIVAGRDYTVVLSKDGWESLEIPLEGICVMEERNLSISNSLSLNDVKSPVINNVFINNGVNTITNTKNKVSISARDFGSGIESMQVVVGDAFDESAEKVPYSSVFEVEVPDGGDAMTVWVRLFDYAGNASDVASVTADVVDRYTEVCGVLSSSSLRWTSDKSPYRVTDSILVESGKTLVIEPGVDVQFDGPHSITVEGTMIADGSEHGRVAFYGVGDGVGSWGGLDFTKSEFLYSGGVAPEYESGSKLSRFTMDGSADGISGFVWVEDGTISSSAIAFDEFQGIVVGSVIEGDVAVGGSIYGSIIRSSNVAFGDGSLWEGNEIEGMGAGSIVYAKGKGRNNILSGMSVTIEGDTENTTFVDCSVGLYGSLHTNNTFESCSVGLSSSVEYSNFEDTDVRVNSSRKDIESVSLKNNFWGYDNLNELRLSSSDTNLSFIYDYYDDFTRTKAVIGSWAEKPYGSSGYMGDKYISYDVEQLNPSATLMSVDNSGRITVYGEYVLRVDSVADNLRFRVLSPDADMSGSGIVESEWRCVENGEIRFYHLGGIIHTSINEFKIQLMDDKGNISSIRNVLLSSTAKGPNGYIFYDKGEYSDGWRFLEAAPADLRIVDGVPTVDASTPGFYSSYTNYSFGHNRDLNTNVDYYVNGNTVYSSRCTGTSVGTGKSNTLKLVNAMGESAYSSSASNHITGNYAAKLCDTLIFNGYDDWFLPSIDELRLMTKNLHSINLGDFIPDNYWSSSESDFSASDAWCLSFIVPYSSGKVTRSSTHIIRPCRSF